MNNTTTIYVQEFPFEELRKPSGDYFDSWQDAKDHGYDDDQIWSVVHGDEDTFCYGPPHHFVNHIGHIATSERHDGNTYYEETWNT